MRRAAAIVGFVGCLPFVGCGQGSEPKKSGTPPAAPVTGAPAAAELPTSSAPVSAKPDFVGTGVVEAQGVTFTMEGTHRLVEGGKTVCLLESRKVDLVAHQGKKVRLSGIARTTVEGGKTIVDVQTIEDLP